MDFSEHFNQEELSDVALRLFFVEAVEDPPTGCRKRHRSAEPERATETRLLFLHKLALYASPYFKSKLQRWEALAAEESLPQGQGPSSRAGAQIAHMRGGYALTYR